MSENTNCTLSNTEAALNAGRALGTVIYAGADRTDGVIVIPNGYKAEATEKLTAPYLERPRRVKAHPSFSRLDSFIEYVNSYQGPHTRIFACVPTPGAPPVFGAILDYHSTNGPAAWCEHRATYAPKFTPEWERWTKRSGEHMDQVAFATLLEENQDLIFEPKGADLLELVQNLEGKNGITCNSLTRLSNGRQRLIYEEQVELRGTTNTNTGQMEFPTELTAGIQAFDGGLTYKIKCRLKYRIPNRRLEFWSECVDLHIVVNDAVAAMVTTIEDELKLKVLYGSANISNA